MTDRGRRLVRWGRVLLAALILLVLFREVPVARVRRSMGEAEHGPLLLAAALAVAAHALVALRLRTLARLQGLSVTYAELFEINLTTLFYGVFLPAGNFTGIAIRFYRVTRRARDHAGTMLALFYDRVAATTTLALTGIAFWIAAWPAWAWPALLGMLLAALGLLVVHLLLFEGARPRFLGRLAERACERFAGTREALRRFRDAPRARVAGVFALGFVVHLVGIAAYTLVAASLDLGLSPLVVAWTRSAAMLLAILPLSVAGLGVREGAFLVLLAPYGVSGEEALAFSFLAFLVTVLLVALLGGLLEAARLLRA